MPEIMNIEPVVSEIEEVVMEDEVLGNLGQLQDSELRDSKCRIIQDIPQEKASPYTPKIISIGPLHHGKRELQPMEIFKRRYLNDLLNRPFKVNRLQGKSTSAPSREGRKELLRRFIKAASEMEERVRSCYVLSNTISSDDFVKMLVIDGCFLLEFLIRSPPFITWVDLGWRLPLIKIDILLFENQIPFFVLEKFYEILKEFGKHTLTMTKIAYDYLNIEKIFFDNKSRKFFKTTVENGNCSSKKIDIGNLLHLCHRIISNEISKEVISEEFSFPKVDPEKGNLPRGSDYPTISTSAMDLEEGNLPQGSDYSTISTSAMELEEAGVRFQGSAMVLRFENGTFFFPVLSLEDKKLCLLKSLLAFEFFCPSLVDPVVHMYVAMIFHLIKNPEDLKVMEKHHIIVKSGGAEESFRLINDLIQSGFRNYEYLEYQRVWNLLSINAALKDYCEKPHHRWFANLMKDYFGSPWSILGLFVGVLLLVLTTLQTVFTVLPYYN